MAKQLLKAKYVLTPEGLKEDYAVRVEDGRIKAVGPASSEALKAEPEDVIETFPDGILAPGFVNGHNHMYGFLSHGITAEAMVTDFSNFLDDFWWPYVEDRVDIPLAELTAKWAACEMIDSGVTAFMDILEGPNAIPGALFAEKKAIDEAGLRGFLSFEACERKSTENGRLGLKENIDFLNACKKEGGLVQGMLSIHTLFTCSRDFIKEAKELCRAAGAVMHMHLSESDFEPGWAKEHYGKMPVEVYEELGVLDDHVLASQLVQVSDREIEILRAHGVHGVSMPLSNCEVGGGIAPLGKLAAAGLKVGLGTDGYVNNFFEVMRGAFLIHKAYLKNPQAMPAKQVYELATRGGAEALGIDAGIIAEGKLADLIVIGTDTPTPVNAHNVYDQLVLFRNPQNVKQVMVNGRWLKKDGKLVTLQAEEIRKELSEAAARFWTVQK